jgi:hypothetical protein
VRVSSTFFTLRANPGASCGGTDIGQARCRAASHGPCVGRPGTDRQARLATGS